MFIDLLNVENDKVVPGVECYTIPEIKNILDLYSKEDSIEILTYIHFLYHPKSAYKNIPERDREDVILEKIRTGDWVEDEGSILIAKKEIEKLYLSPTRRFFYSNKRSLEKLSKYMETTTIEAGKDGNFSTYVNTLSKVGKIMEDFKKIEKMVEDEEKITIRGDQEISDI